MNDCNGSQKITQITTIKPHKWGEGLAERGKAVEMGANVGIIIIRMKLHAYEVIKQQPQWKLRYTYLLYKKRHQKWTWFLTLTLTFSTRFPVREK